MSGADSSQTLTGQPSPAAGLLWTVAVTGSFAGTLVRSVAAAGTTTTSPALTDPTSVGSEYGFASFLFFLVIIVGVVWLWRLRVGRGG